MEPSYTTEEIASLLKISKLTVYDLIKKGELPAYRVGRQMRIDAKDLEVYKERAKQGVHGETEPEMCRRSDPPPHRSKTEGHQVILTGQDLSLDLLSRHLEKRDPRIRLLRSNKGSMESLIGLFRGEVDIASSHLFDGETGTFNTPYLSKLLSGYRYIVINLVTRKAGLYVQKGNPKRLQGWSDLKNKDLTLINREKGSGARVLLDEQLRLQGISRDQLTGYNHEETGHLGVAAVIANGDADVGVGSERSAQIVGIDFIPLIEERYDLVLLKAERNQALIQHIKDLLNSTAFKNELQYFGGYDLSKTGQIIFEN